MPPLWLPWRSGGCISAAAREGVLGDNPRAYPVQVTDEMLVSELTKAYVAYLGPRPRGTRR